MKFLTTVFLTLLPYAGSATMSPHIDTINVSDDLNVLASKDDGSNIGVISSNNQLILIDPMPGQKNLDELESTIKALTKMPVAFILNTHEHEDHTGGNSFFISKGAKVLYDASDLKSIEQIEVISHTSTDRIFFHQKSNSMFVGDVFDASWHPTFYAGGLAGFDDAIDKILAVGDANTRIIPGHGKPTNKRAVQEFRNNTHAWVKRVKEMHSDGATIEKVTKDEKALRILQRFNVENVEPFLPQKALYRFVERTFAIIEAD